jgi:hypothetical protein
MAPTFDETINAFGAQVRVLVDQVCEIRNRAFRKALYVSMLDGLSACAYGDSMRPGIRFRTFVLQIGGWTDGERISLPQAALLFHAVPAMSAAISARLANWNWGTPQPITSDPFAHELGIPDVDFSKVQHVNLLWKFRNSILHAVYDPGGFDFPGHLDPYYTGDIDTRTWRLVIPDAFLERLLRASLQNLLVHCKQEGLDPQVHLGRELWV